MSEIKTQAQQRAELVTVLDGLTAAVGGATITLTAHPTEPKTPTAYDAWPVWVATRPVTWCAVELDWQIIIALPGSDAQTWVLTGDELVEVVSSALDAYAISRVEPVQILVADGQAMPGLAFTVTI